MPHPRIILLQEPLTSVSISERGNPDADLAHRLAEAEQRGLQSGIRSAQQQLNAQVMQQREELMKLRDHTLTGIEKAYGEMVTEIENRIPALVIGLCEKLLGGFSPDSKTVASIVRETIRESGSNAAEEMEISLSEHDYGLIADPDGSAKSFPRKTRFVIDPNLNPGDCVIRSDFGLTDARLDSKMKRMRSHLLHEEYEPQSDPAS